MEPEVTKLTRDDCAYFEIRWSRLVGLDRHTVIRKVPSTAGIFEIYRYNGGRTARLIGRSRAYYGGLRNTLRGLIDPISPYPLNGELLPLDETHLVRFSLTDSSQDMDDIMFFFAGRDDYEASDQDHSGRYRYVYVKEITPEPVKDEVVPES